jgi:hypothetical protein
MIEYQIDTFETIPYKNRHVSVPFNNVEAFLRLRTQLDEYDREIVLEIIDSYKRKADVNNDCLFLSYGHNNNLQQLEKHVNYVYEEKFVKKCHDVAFRIQSIFYPTYVLKSIGLKESVSLLSQAFPEIDIDFVHINPAGEVPHIIVSAGPLKLKLQNLSKPGNIKIDSLIRKFENVGIMNPTNQKSFEKLKTDLALLAKYFEPLDKKYNEAFKGKVVFHISND